MSNAIQPYNTSICYENYPEGSYIAYDAPSIGYTFAKSMPLIFSTGLLSRLSCGYLSVKGLVPTTLMSLVISVASNFFATEFEELALQQARGRDPNWGGAFSFETEDLVHQNGTHVNFALAAGGAASSAISNGKFFTHGANRDILKLESSLMGNKVSTLNAVETYMSLNNKKQNLELGIKETRSLTETLQGSLNSLNLLFQKHFAKLMPGYGINEAAVRDAAVARAAAAAATARATDAAVQAAVQAGVQVAISTAGVQGDLDHIIARATDAATAAATAAASVVARASAFAEDAVKNAAADAVAGGGADAVAAVAGGGAAAVAAVAGGGADAVAAVAGGGAAAAADAAADAAAAAVAGGRTRASWYGRLFSWFTNKKASPVVALAPAVENAEQVQNAFPRVIKFASKELHPQLKQQLSEKFFRDFSKTFPYDASKATQFLNSIGEQATNDWEAILAQINALGLDPAGSEGVKSMLFKIFSDKIKLRQFEGQLASYTAQLSITSEEIATFLREGNSLGQVSSEFQANAKNWKKLKELQANRKFSQYSPQDVIGKTQKAVNKRWALDNIFKALEIGAIGWQGYNFVMEQFNFVDKLRDTCIEQVEANQ